MPMSSVQALIKWKIREFVETKLWSGRPTKISATTARKISQDAKNNPQITSADLTDPEKSGVAVSRCKKWMHLKKNGLHG